MFLYNGTIIRLFLHCCLCFVLPNYGTLISFSCLLCHVEIVLTK